MTPRGCWSAGEGGEHGPPEGHGAHPAGALAAGTEVPAPLGGARRLQPV